MLAKLQTAHLPNTSVELNFLDNQGKEIYIFFSGHNYYFSRGLLLSPYHCKVSAKYI